MRARRSVGTSLPMADAVAALEDPLQWDVWRRRAATAIVPSLRSACRHSRDSLSRVRHESAFLAGRDEQRPGRGFRRPRSHDDRHRHRKRDFVRRGTDGNDAGRKGWRPCHFVGNEWRNPGSARCLLWAKYFYRPRMVPACHGDVPARRAHSYRLQHDGVDGPGADGGGSLRIGALSISVRRLGDSQLRGQRFCEGPRKFLDWRKRRDSWLDWAADRDHLAAWRVVHEGAALAFDFLGRDHLRDGIAVQRAANRQLGALWGAGGWISARKAVRGSPA